MSDAPELSRRLSTLTPGSDGWDLYRRAQAMIAAGRSVIDLTIGEHDTRTDPAILDEMHRAARAGHTGYAAVPGIPALRAAIAVRIAARTGVPTAPGNILVTPGGQAALFAAHHAVCDEGDRALFIDPHYATYPGTIRAVGAVPVAVPAPAAQGFRPDPERLAQVAAGARSLLINTPNNPTGAVYPRATLEGIAALCRTAGLWLISDEVYDTQVWEGAHLSPRALPGMAERTLVVGSMSKSHAMTGSRVGWVCGPEVVIAHLANLATHTTYGIPGFIQEAALFALRAGPELEARVAAPFRRRRDLVARCLARQQVVAAAPMQGAMYAFLDIRATGLTGEDFASRLLEEDGVAVMPGESFGTAAAGHLRVALTVPDPLLEAAVDRLVARAARLSRG